MRLSLTLTALAPLAMLHGAAAAETAAAPAAPAAAEPANPAERALFDEAGYRNARYRSPVRSDPAPAAQMDLAISLDLEPGKTALFIDVMPAEGGVRDPQTGSWTLSQQHLTIPGAWWYPETGRAPVNDDLWQALKNKVADARRTAPDQPVIMFCRADCWMSWNAARRMAQQGIGNVWWLAEGTDGWHAAGRPLVPAVPVITPATGPALQE